MIVFESEEHLGPCETLLVSKLELQVLIFHEVEREVDSVAKDLRDQRIVQFDISLVDPFLDLLGHCDGVIGIAAEDLEVNF